MKNLKKVLALVLVFAMSLTAVAFAGTTYPDVADDAVQADAVKVLKDLGIMVGDENGNFNPDKVVTRAEMAVILCNMTGAGEQSPVDSGFEDATAAHWASGCIAYAKNAGWISGYSDTQFGSEDTIKWEQAVKLIMATMKWETYADKNGGYPTGWVMAGAEAGVTTKKGATGAVGEDCTRAKIAMLVYNALEADMMKQTAYGSDDKTEVVEGENLLGKYLDTYVLEGTVERSYKTDDSLDEGEVAFKIEKRGTTQAEKALDLTYDENDAPYGSTAIIYDATGTNAADLLYYSSKAYIAVDEDGDESIVAIVAKGKNKVTSIADIDNVYNANEDGDVKDSKKPDFTGAKDYYQFSYWAEDRDTDDAISTAKLEKTAKIIVNGVDKGTVDADIFSNYFNGKIGSAELIDNDNDGKIEYIIVKNYGVAVVDSVNTAKEKITFKAKTKGLKGSISFNKDDVTTLNDYTITLDGKAIDLADLQENDVLAVSTNDVDAPLYYDIIVTREKVEGKITGTKTGKIYLGSDEYEYRDIVDSKDLEIGTEGIYYLDSTGKIAYVDETTVVSDKFAVIQQLGKDSMDNVTAKMFTYEGNIVTVDVAEKIKINDVKVKLTGAVDTDDLDDMGLTNKANAATYYELVKNILAGTEAVDSTMDKNLNKFVTYSMSGDELSAITFASGDDLKYAGKPAGKVEWQASGSKFKGSKTLGANVKIFSLGEDNDIDDYVIGTPSSLIDEHYYQPYFFRTGTDSSIAAVVLLETVSNIDENAALAFFKSYRSGVYGDDDQDCYFVSYWVDGALAAEPLTIDKGDMNKSELDAFKAGDAFLYAVNGDTVDDMIKVYSIEGNYFDGTTDLDENVAKYSFTGLKEFTSYNSNDSKDNEVYFGILVKASDGSIKVVDASAASKETVDTEKYWRLDSDAFETVNVASTAKVYQYTKSSKEDNTIKAVDSIVDLNVSETTKVSGSDDLRIEAGADLARDLSFVFFRMNNGTVTEVVGIDYLRK